MTDDSVIEARRALARYEDRNSKPNPAHLADAIRLLLARIDEAGAVFEKAHAPTDDERKVLDRAVRGVTWNASNYPRRAQPHILGADIGPLTTKIVEAVESAGFRHPEVPEPQGEPTDAQVRKVAHTGPGHASGDAGYCEGCLAEREPQGEPSAGNLDHYTDPDDPFWQSRPEPVPQGEPSDAQALEGFLGKLAGSGAYALDFTSAESLHGHIVWILKRDIAALRAAGGVR